MNQIPPSLLLIGHGSPDPAGNAEFQQFADALATHLGVAVQTCFLELAAPAIGAGFDRCVQAGARQIAALPLFLSPGRHQKRDVPALLAEARQITLASSCATARRLGRTSRWSTLWPHARLRPWP